MISDMQLISSRTIPFLDTETLTASEAREALLRDHNGGFILYLSDGAPSSKQKERMIRLDLRAALIWLNEPAQEQGSFWM